MITIKHKDSNIVKVVTQGAYENYYESLGYEPVKEKKEVSKKEVENKEIENKEKPLKTENKGERERFSRK